jgi:hypothetical protein
MFKWLCLSGQGKVAMFKWPCLSGHAFVAMFKWPRFCGHAKTATLKQKHGRFGVGAFTLAAMPKGTRFCDHAKAEMSVKFIHRSALNFLSETMYLWQHISPRQHISILT